MPAPIQLPGSRTALPTLGATLGSRRCQRMERRATAATGEPANTFSYGMQRRRHLIPPSPPLPPSNIYQPPAQLLGLGDLGLSSLPSPSKGHLGFRPACASPCLQVIATWSRWTRSRAWVGTEHSDIFYCWGTLGQGGLGAAGAQGAGGGRQNGFLNSCCAEHCKTVPTLCGQGLG